MNQNSNPSLKSVQPLIVSLSMVKNEEDIIESFVRHNAQFIDIFCILDNDSFDNTRYILESLKQEGFRIIIIDDPEKAYEQAKKMTRLSHHTMITLFPDFLVYLDADEFIRCSSKQDFLNEIEKIPRYGIGLMSWQSYLMNHPESSSGSGKQLSSLQIRLTNEYQNYDKIIVRTNGEYLPELIINQGNHNATGVVESVKLNFKLAHYPVRSPQQLQEKCISGWMAYLIKNPNARNDIYGFHWMNIFDDIKNGKKIDHEYAINKSANYTLNKHFEYKNNIVEDPLVFNFNKLLYSENEDLNSYSKMAKLIENNLGIKPHEAAIKIKTDLENIKQSIYKKNTSKHEQIFSDSWHLENFYFDVPPFKYLAEKIKPESVLDIGCGAGQYLSYFKYTGSKNILGIDGISQSASLLNESDFISIDLENNFEINRSYELGICLELLEHLNEDTALSVLVKLAKHSSKYILFSAAEPNQPGINHINCKPIHYWIEQLDKLGWQVNEFESVTIRMMSSFLWFKRNLLLFEKKKDNNEPLDLKLIRYIGQKKIKWWNQHPQIVHSCLESNNTIPDYSIYSIENKDIDEELNKNHNINSENKSEKATQLKLLQTIDFKSFKETISIKTITENISTFKFTALNNDPIIILPELDIINSHHLILRVECNVPEKTFAQLFFNNTQSGAIYDENNSIIEQLIKGKNMIDFKLPVFDQKVVFRFDPGACSGNYEIFKIELLKET